MNVPPTIEQLLSVAPPGPYWYRNDESPWFVKKNGEAYCSICVLRAMQGRSETIEAIGLRVTESRKKLGSDPQCKHCGRRKRLEQSPNSVSDPYWDQKRAPLVRDPRSNSSSAPKALLVAIIRSFFPSLLNEYNARDSRLRRMGFASYYDYLDSPLWRSIRQEVFAKHKGVCYACKSRAQVIHHRNYRQEVLAGKDLNAEDVVPVCRLCHRIAEVLDSGDKLCIEDANRRLDMLAAAFRSHEALIQAKSEHEASKIEKLSVKVQSINKHFPEGSYPSEERRDAWLEALGFGCYDSYLNSEFWSSIRARVLDASDWRCCRCAERASQAHIRNFRFKTLAGIDLSSESLVPVCDRCWVFAWLSNTVKTAQREVNTILKLRNREGFGEK